MSSWPIVEEHAAANELYAYATGHADPHTKGAWEELVQYDASTGDPLPGFDGMPFDVSALQVSRFITYRDGEDACRGLFDIGVGSDPNDPATFRIYKDLLTMELSGDDARVFSGSVPVELPIPIRKGGHAWLRLQTDIGGVDGDLDCIPLGVGWRGPRGPVLLPGGAIGVDLANTRGTQVTSAEDAMGAWTPLSTSLPHACRGLILAWGVPEGFAADDSFGIQLGIGPSGQEVPIWLADGLAARTASNAGFRPMFFRVPVAMARGARLSGRMKTSQAGGVVSDLTAYLVG